MTPIEANQEVTHYFLKGFGIYKSSTSRTQDAWSEQDLNLRTQSRDDFEYPAESTTLETTFVSSNVNVTPTSFSAITPTEYASTAYLDAWTWVGQFPWVYNTNTDSWFYYYFKGSACNAYEARTSKWYTFDGQQKTWVNAN
jgi:hypothetical protein